MQYRKFGKTGLNVSEIGFGGWTIGGAKKIGDRGPSGWGNVDDDESMRAIHKALDCGINFIDTAHAYGLGHSEKIIGRAVKGIRDKWIIMTKTGSFVEGDKIIFDISAKAIMKYADESLTRLNSDYIDVYLLHLGTVNPETKGEVWEVFETFNKLRDMGKIRYYGISSSGGNVNPAIDLVRKYEMDAVQAAYNIFDQGAADILFPLAQERNMGVVARAPLAQGFLADKWSLETKFPDDDLRCRYNDKSRKDFIQNLEKVEQLRFLKNESTKTMARAAIKFALSNKAVSVVLPGIRTAKQAEENAGVSDGKLLSSDDLKKIKDLYENNFYLEE